MDLQPTPRTTHHGTGCGGDTGSAMKHESRSCGQGNIELDRSVLAVEKLEQAVTTGDNDMLWLTLTQ